MKLPIVHCPFCHKPVDILQVKINTFDNLKFYCCCNNLNCVHKKIIFVPSEIEEKKILNDEQVVVESTL